jgi:hypothetical protein
MSLIVEDGTGIANAESYCSVAQASAYHGARSTADAWANLDTPTQESNLRTATDYLTQMYTMRWAGKRRYLAQSLDWPRWGVPWPNGYALFRPDGVMPPELISATAELALKAASGPLMDDLGREATSESIDVIHVTYQPGSNRQTEYASVALWLRPLLIYNAGIPITRG